MFFLSLSFSGVNFRLHFAGGGGVLFFLYIVPARDLLSAPIEGIKIKGFFEATTILHVHASV